MDDKKTFIEGLAKYLEILPIAIAILDEDFKIIDFNYAFEQFRREKTDDNTDNFKKLWNNSTAVKGSIESPEGDKYKLLILPTIVSQINNNDDFIIQLRLYLDGLQFAGVLNIDENKLMANITQKITRIESKNAEPLYDERKIALQKAIIVNRNFIERNLIEGFLRKLGYRPIVRWVEDDIEDLIDMSGNVQFVVVCDNLIHLVESAVIPKIILVDFGRKVPVSKKFPDATIVERPLNFEDFKDAVEKIKKSYT